jgi:hypothetical protein
MQRVKIVETEMKENETLFVALNLETKNASILLLSEGEDQLGTLAVGLPQKEKMLGPPMSSVLLGDRNMIVARLLAERLAQKTGKIALTSVFAKTVAEKDAGSIFLRLFDKTLKGETEEGEKK